jgi:hypothetical protein
MVKIRGYSRKYTPKTERRLTFMADRVPATLYDAVTAKAKREDRSIRTLILSLLEKWVKGDN